MSDILKDLAIVAGSSFLGWAATRAWNLIIRIRVIEVKVKDLQEDVINLQKYRKTDLMQ